MKRDIFWRVVAVIGLVLFAAQLVETWFFMSRIIPPLAKLLASLAGRME